MKSWYKMAKSDFVEDDRVRAIFRGKAYEGKLDYVEDGTYWIKFDDYDRLYEEDNPRTIDLTNWMDDTFQDGEFELVSHGPRWGNKKSDLDLVNKEKFYYNGVEWDVLEAKRIIYLKPRGIVKFDVKSVEYYVRSGLVNVGVLDNADLSVPIILVSHGNGVRDQFPIDGWHRISKALEEGVDELPAYVLDIEESRRIRSV